MLVTLCHSALYRFKLDDTSSASILEPSFIQCSCLMLPTPPHRCFIIVDNSTIRERRDKQQERPPTKRQRVESDDEDYRKDGLAQTASTSQNRWVPQACPAATTGSIETEFVELDPTYYTESPDSIIVRVQNTLFKVSCLSSFPVAMHMIPTVP